MRYLLIVLLSLAPSLHGTDPATPRTPADQYRMLSKEYQDAEQAASKSIGEAKTDEARKISRSQFPKIEQFAPRFLELAQKCPADPVACDALVWILEHGLSGFDAAPTRIGFMGPAMEILARDHVNDGRIASVCLRLARHPSPVRDRFLASVYQQSKNRAVRGHACLALADYLANKAKAAESAKNLDDAVHQRLAQLYGEQYLGELRACDAVALRSQADDLYETMIRDYGDLETKSRKMLLAEHAKTALAELRNLRIGKVTPDIDGADIDGHRFKLSDFRGKVVLLTFSGNWCGPCRAMYPEEREHVARLKDRPFVMLSVNTDDQKETVRNSIASGEITWRCWWDGGAPGPICKAWNVYSFPTIYVIDARGVIRYRNVRYESLAKALDALMKEMEAPAKS
jgi:peroxiredoxin